MASFQRPPFMLCLLSVLAAGTALAGEEWPDLSTPAGIVGGGENDAAVVVGVEGYFAVPPVPGAESNAKAWYDYLTKTRGAPAGRVKLRLNADATREEMLEAAQKATAKAGPNGTLWFVFIGHGAPAGDGKDGLLIGVDAQQKAASLQTRSLRRGELLSALAAGKAGRIVVVLDACFSGRGQDGATIAPGLQPLVTVTLAGAVDPRMVVLTAAKGDQFAGALPGAARPAFSYLVLGGLRGWAGQERITAGDLWRYASDALEATLQGRNQTPDLIGDKRTVVGVSAGEKAPDLAALAKASAGGGEFHVANLPAVPKAVAPKALGSSAAAGLDFRAVDIDALKKYDAALELDKSADASADDKAQSWRQLAKDAPKLRVMAEKRAQEWDRYAEQWKAGEEARQKRIEARDADWEKLGQLLVLNVVPEEDKGRWSGKFLRAYRRSPGLEPAMAAELVKHVESGAVHNALEKLAKSAPAQEAAPRTVRVAAGKADIQWVTIRGGSFMMGADDVGSEAQPRHQVTIKTFKMAKTLVTNKQYKACVEAGACSSPGSESHCGNVSSSDDQPVVCVDWNQAKAFAAWVGGRLPSEAEWEYAARSAGKERKYPWGDEDATCERAVVNQGSYGCGRNATWPVCSKTAGNTEQGLCDMAGNAWEWVQDWYHSSYDGAPTDNSAWESPPGSHRVVRGGSWTNDESQTRAASRYFNTPGDRYSHVSFRLVR